ncbi:MAG TPA: aldehyde dehydrogenase family protein, partial [Roseomonas sp.]
MLDTAAKLVLKDPDLFRQANRVGSQWVQAASGKTIAVKNPASGEVIGQVPSLSREEVRGAIEAAQAAQPAWRALLAKERAAILRRLFTLMMENVDDLAA